MEQVVLKVGDAVRILDGREGHVAGFSKDEKQVRVNFNFGNKHGWYDVGDVNPKSPDVPTKASTDMYPVGAEITNVAGEKLRVVNRWQDQVKLQPMALTGKGAIKTEWEAHGEPFALSEEDTGLWETKWLKPGDVVENHNGLIEVLAEIRIPDDPDIMTAETAREYRLGLRFATRNPLSASVGSIHIEAVKSKVTDSVASAFRLLTDFGNPKKLQELVDDLRTECTLLHRENDKLKEAATTPALPRSPFAKANSDELAKAIEDAAKAKAQLLDAEKRIKDLEYKNQQQSKLLSEATAPNPTPLSPPQSIGEGKQTIKTLVSMGGSGGFNDINIPPGYQLAAITTEVKVGATMPQLYRFVHIVGYGNEPDTPEREASETVIVEDADPVQDAFEQALKRGASPEETIAVGNERVVSLAWQAAQTRRGAQSPTRTPTFLLKEGQL